MKGTDMKALAVAVAIGLALAGCGGTSSSNAKPTTTSTTTDPVVHLDDSERFSIARACVAADIIVGGDVNGIAPSSASVDEILNNSYPVANVGAIGDVLDQLRAATTVSATLDAVRTVKTWCEQP